MSFEEIHFYQAKCDNCGKTLKYDSTQFGGNAWHLFPRVYDWYVERNDDRLSQWMVLCPKCKNTKVIDEPDTIRNELTDGELLIGDA